MAEVVPVESVGTDGVVNCHFSVNQTILRSMVQPMLSEMLRDLRHEDRLAQLEVSQDRLQLGLEQKADAKALRDMVSSVQEQKQQLSQKAEWRTCVDLKASLARLEDTVSYKAHQTSIDEATATLQRLSEIAGQKADLSYVNRTNERVHKLTQASSQQEKQLAELIAAKETQEAWRLPQTLQRTRDMLLKTNSNLKSLQDTVSLKADQQLVDELILGYKEVETNLHWKASQQSVVELNASVHELHRQLETKVGQLAIEEGPFQELDNIKGQLEFKAGQHEVQEMALSLKAVERTLTQKADFSCLNDARARNNAIEVIVQQKADRQDFSEVTVAMGELRGWMVQKVDQLVLDFSKRPEAEALVNAEAALERLLQVFEQKADVQTMNEVERKLDDLHSDILRQLGQKVEQSSFEETVESLALRMGTGSPGSARSAGYPLSTISQTSLSTTDSYPAARKAGKNPNARSPSARGVSPANRVGRPPLRENKP